MDFLKKISGGLKKTSENFSSGLENIFNKSKPARNVLQELEDFMISSDISLSLTEKIINNTETKKYLMIKQVLQFCNIYLLILSYN